MNAIGISMLKSSRQRFPLWSLVLFPAISALLLGTADQALAATYQVTDPNCSATPGGFEWALQQANANPGRDTVEITNSFDVDDCKHHPGEQYPETEVTESLDIVGNGFTVSGEVGFLNPDGFLNRMGHCPNSTDNWIDFGGALIDVGQRGADNQGIEVTIKGLNMTRLTGIALVRKNAKLTIENSKIEKIFSVYGQTCNRPIISALENADVTIKNTSMMFISEPETAFPSTDFPLITGVIEGIGGDLVMDGVVMSNVVGETVSNIHWTGGTVKIVNSEFVDTPGIWLDSGSMDFVNSIYNTGGEGLRFNSNFAIRGSTARFQASTFWWGQNGDGCDRTKVSSTCPFKVLGFYGNSSGIRFEGSAIGGDGIVGSFPVFYGSQSQFSSDTYTWVQPRAGQDASEIHAYLPNALTGPPGLPDFPAHTSLDRLYLVTPRLGSQSNPGLLIDAIPSGAAPLLNPIDNLPIVTDAFGLPRYDGNGARNIGAVQTSLASALVLNSTGNAHVVVSWNQVSLSATGYRVSYRPVGTSTWNTKDFGSDVFSAVLTGLTNGTRYEVQVEGISGAGTGPASNLVTGTPLGGAPTANPDSYATAKNVPLVVAAAQGVSANDDDPNNGSLTVLLVSPPQHGQLQFSGDGSLSYTPASDYVGSDSFQYSTTSSVSGLSSLPAVVTLNVANYSAGGRGSTGGGTSGATPIAPIASNDAWAVPFNTTLTIASLGVLTNDFDPQGYQLRATVKDQPASGTLVLDAIGGFVYTPNAGFVGRDTFTYVVSNGALSSVASVTLNVLGNGSDEPPIGNPDAYATPQDVILDVALPGVLANDYDPERVTVTAIVQDQPTHGLLALSERGRLSYFPNPGYIGIDTFTYVTSDGLQTGNPVLVTISVRDPATDHAPVAHPDQWSTPKGTTLAVGPLAGILVNDHDAEGNALKITYLTQPSNGLFAPVDGGGFVYTPNSGFSGNDSFTYSVSDGLQSSAPATVTLRVNAKNRRPRARNNHYPLREDEILDVYGPGILANDLDPEGNELKPVIKRYPRHGSLALQLDGGFTYIPDLYFHGKDSFTYTVSDGERKSKLATVKFKVKKPSRKLLRSPRAGRNHYSLPVGSVLSVPARGLLWNDRDPQGDPLLVYLENQPAHGGIHLGIDGSFKYYPEDGFSGHDQFTYRVYDGLFSSKPAKVKLVVKAREKAPRAEGGQFKKSLDAVVLRINAPGLRRYASDKNGNYLTPFIVDYPKHGLLKLNSNGAFDYFPDKGFQGTDRFRWRVTDGLFDSKRVTSVIDTREGE